jgi:5'-nucleotidase (lipoprotein e(P4) family)
MRAHACRSLIVAAALASIAPSPAGAADAAPQNDLLNAELWMQTAIEYRANCLTVYALARTRLDEALADKDWTATAQSGNYRDLPPAVILDLDETAIDNSPYEAGLAVSGRDFDPKTWDAWTRAEQAKAIPGAVEFTTYAASKGVKVFYVSNRNADQKEATRRNVQALGFPMGGNVDTFLCRRTGPNGPPAPRARASPMSPRIIACCCCSATTSAISATTITAASPSAARVSRR